MSKQHSVTVTITSKSGDAVNQVVSLQEFAATEEELVAKNWVIADKVTKACWEACAELSAPLRKVK